MYKRQVEDLAKYGNIPIINGLTDFCHPCQILADLMTIREVKGCLDGLKMCYIGDGNNMMNSLIVGGLKMGMGVSVACPEGYDPEDVYKRQVYALPELFREKIKGKKVIANPGCYTTGVPLALAPAIKNGLVETEGIIADCKSGVTGAGRGLSQNTHYPDLNEGFHPYKVAAHRHTPEMEQTLSHLADKPVKITFVPHLLPVNRGILSTCYARLKPGVTEEQMRKAYEDFYRDEFFVRLLPAGKCADIHNIKCSNFCDISLHMDLRTGTFIAVSAIDNMVKGAAGQAIQNMNLAFGLEETMGLTMVPAAF